MKPRVSTTASIVVGATLVSAASVFFYASRSIEMVNSLLLWCRGAVDFFQKMPTAALLPLAVLASILAVSLVRGVRTIVRQVISHRNLNRLAVAQSAPMSARLKERLPNKKLEASIVMIETDELCTFVFGLLRPRIYLSRATTEAIDDDELRALLQHEIYHLQQYDPLKKFLFTLAQDVLFFLPSLGDMKSLFFLQQELSADRAAIGGASGKKSLASVMLKMAEHGQQEHEAELLASYFHPTRERLKHLMADSDFDMTIELSSSRLLVSVVMLVGIVAFSVLPPTAYASAEATAGSSECAHQASEAATNQSLLPQDPLLGTAEMSHMIYSSKFH